jgi:hypothetical protein
MAEPDCFIFETTEMSALRAVMRRLYAPSPLTPDERRDLANIMDATLAKAVPADSAKLPVPLL